LAVLGPSALPASSPLLGLLIAGFVLLVVGLGVLTVGGRKHPMASRVSTMRAFGYVLVFGLCTWCFYRILEGAVLGYERSPWLLALGDVIFVTLGLYTWVMVLAEGHSLEAYGMKRVSAGRLFLTLLMGVGAVAVYSLGSYRALWTYQIQLTPDTLTFALTFAAAGSAFTEEMLFRGFLQGSMNGRVSRWARVAVPAIAFTIVRAARFWPGHGLGWTEWMGYIFGVALPLGLWWGLMRELAGGAIWPSLISHFFLEFGPALAGKSPALP